ncbi:MAG: hypothetical protein QOI74_1842 [Micromonosporaceae bacterium]|nr:hypothetical protein [Micromonosporaceae bacterium]
MPAVRVDPATRRGIVPLAAGRSLRFAAAWTGAGTALVSAVVAIAVVAVCWLPAAGASGSATSAIKAGVLTFLAALHGGVTVDGLSAAFVPLGMTVLVGAIAWRAGAGLADVAADLGEQRSGPLVQAIGLQAGAFAAVCGLGAGLVTLGTSSVSVLAAVAAGLVLFACTGGAAFVRSSPLADEVGDRAPQWLGPALRAAAAGITVYLGAGALLVAGAVVVHREQVEELSRQVGGGWSGVPVLLLGILAAPNAVIAAASYLAGPGFALGSGSGVSFGSTVHGTMPAFPVLGAVPSGPATTPVWLLMAVTPVVAGLCVARAWRVAPSWSLRLRTAGASVGLAVVLGGVLAWQGGGAIGSGRLRAFGASPWQFGLAIGGGLAAVGGTSMAALAGLAWWRGRGGGSSGGLRSTLAAVASAVSRDETVPDADQDDKLAG